MKCSTIIFLTLLATTTTAFAQEPVLLNDFTTQGAGSFNYSNTIEGIVVDPSPEENTDEVLFFLADDDIRGEELWRTDGTEIGTQLTKDIWSGIESSNINLMGNIGNTVFFGANDGEHGFELWKTQGTTASTQMVTDLNEGVGSGISSDQGRHIIFNDTLYFRGTKDKGAELYKTAGTEATTTLIKDINPGLGSGWPLHMTAARDAIYFVADDGEHGKELWKTDGTEAGTSLIEDITEGNESTEFYQLKTFNNTLIFVADDGIHGAELWISLGNAGFTFMVKDITEGAESSDIEILGVVNDVIYFTVKESAFGNLWKSDGTEEGTEMVLNEEGDDIRISGYTFYEDELFFLEWGSDKLWKTNGNEKSIVWTDNNISFSQELAVMNDILYFTVIKNHDSHSLWKTDGTTEGTTLVKEIVIDGYNGKIYNFIPTTDRLYFIADTEEFGRELWVSDGTAAGTHLLVDATPGSADSYSYNAQVTAHFVRNKLLFPGHDEIHGRELWATNGTLDGTALVKDINIRNQDVHLSGLPVAFQNQTYFITREGIWQTDGTAAGTRLFQEASSASGLNVLEDQLLYTAFDTLSNRRTIWTSDGTSEGTRPLLDSALASEISIPFWNITPRPQMNGQLFFEGNDGEHGGELWKTDGTPEGTMMVKDIKAGSEGSVDGSSFFYYIIFNDQLYFSADPLDGSELWKSDGTEEGTVQLTDINPFGSSYPENFTVVDSTIFFSAYDGASGRELWKTDGTAAGTVMVKDIYPGENHGLSSAPFLTNFQGTLYFAGNDGEHGRELWRSDGTEEGTYMVKDIHPENSFPFGLFATDSVLLFIATDQGGKEGRKIWRTDGTEAGTQPLLDLEVIPNSTQLTEANGTLFFTAEYDDGSSGLWRTDGTPEGTQPIQGVFSPPQEYAPSLAGFVEDVLYFRAEHPTKGRELWTLTPLRMQAELESSSAEVCTTEDSLTFTVTTTDAGSNPTYRWFINRQLAAETPDATFTASGLFEGDEISVQIVAGKDVWVLQDSVLSSSITISSSALNPAITVEGSQLTATEGATYQWYLEGEALADATTQTITAQQSGNYQVEITNASGCVARSEEVEVIVCTSDVPTIQVEGTTLTASEEGTYRWFLDGEELPDTTQSIEAEEEGNYQVEVTDASGCVARSEEVKVEATVTSLVDERLVEGLTMYPNPVTSRLTIDLPLNEAVLLAIYSSAGQLRHQSTLPPQSAGHQVALDHLPPGLYLVRFASQQGVYQRKLIKR